MKCMYVYVCMNVHIFIYIIRKQPSAKTSRKAMNPKVNFSHCSTKIPVHKQTQMEVVTMAGLGFPNVLAHCHQVHQEAPWEAHPCFQTVQATADGETPRPRLMVTVVDSILSLVLQVVLKWVKRVPKHRT